MPPSPHSSPRRRIAADKLHLYNWNNYIAPETVKRFEESCKCEVVQTYYSDNEELLAKLAAGPRVTTCSCPRPTPSRR